LSPAQALLFWFYRDAGVCAERLRKLGELHPGQPVYGLYGGPEEEAASFERALGPRLDDFYVATRQPDPYLKWLQGDLEIVEWFEARGRALAWSSLAVVQWDLLVKAPLDRLLPGLGPAHLYFTGLRALDPALESRWYWTRQGNHQRSYHRFRAQIARSFGFHGTPLCCLFIFAVLTRAFLEVYARDAPRLSGFLEYKLPTLARLHGFSCLVGDLGVLWDPVEQPAPRPLRALPEAVPRSYIEAELARPDGFRLFHPVPYAWEGDGADVE
jgi:hypothetical protein